jgi:hypothetical protein
MYELRVGKTLTSYFNLKVTQSVVAPTQRWAMQISDNY